MKALIQRVNHSSVSSEGVISGEIQKGFTVLLGVQEGDTEEDVNYLVNKVTNLRIFEDEDGKMNRSLLECGGELLVVSQFTLLADTRKGRRPSFVNAAKPDVADTLYRQFVVECRKMGITTETGVFQTHMVVTIENDGPVTILIDSRERGMKHEDTN